MKKILLGIAWSGILLLSNCNRPVQQKTDGIKDDVDSIVASHKAIEDSIAESDRTQRDSIINGFQNSN